MDINREILSFDEKIALAELEASKARERVKELKYNKARFLLDLHIQFLREKEARDNKRGPDFTQDPGGTVAGGQLPV